MSLHVVELKPFVPARDFALSRRFYAELGFTERSEVGGVAYFLVSEVVQQSWRMRDFALWDPSGVLWRIAQNV